MATNTNANKNNKVLSIIVIVLLAALVGIVVWQVFFGSSYAAVYLKTGDLYFGKLVQLPSFGLKNVYMIQANPQNTQTPLSIQKFTNVFWGPQDYLKINRSEVVWTTNLRADSQLLKVFKENPNLAAPQGEQAPQGPGQLQQPAPQSPPAPETKSETPKAKE